MRRVYAVGGYSLVRFDGTEPMDFDAIEHWDSVEPVLPDEWESEFTNRVVDPAQTPGV